MTFKVTFGPLFGSPFVRTLVIFVCQKSFLFSFFFLFFFFFVVVVCVCVCVCVPMFSFIFLK